MELNFLTKEKNLINIELDCDLVDAKFYFFDIVEKENIIRCKIVCIDEAKAKLLLNKIKIYKIRKSFIPLSEFEPIDNCF